MIPLHYCLGRICRVPKVGYVPATVGLQSEMHQGRVACTMRLVCGEPDHLVRDPLRSLYSVACAVATVVAPSAIRQTVQRHTARGRQIAHLLRWSRNSLRRAPSASLNQRCGVTRPVIGPTYPCSALAERRGEMLRQTLASLAELRAARMQSYRGAPTRSAGEQRQVRRLSLRRLSLRSILLVLEWLCFDMRLPSCEDPGRLPSALPLLIIDFA